MQKEYEIDIYGLAYGGDGVGKLNDKVCFVEAALPGERVCFRKQVEKKSFIKGVTTKALTTSSDRIEPVCRYYGKCGGCQYQHINYEKEVSSKAEQVKEIFRRIGGFEKFEFRGITPSPVEYGYRSSITLHRSENGYGYFAKRDKTIIPILECPLAADSINALIKSNPSLSKKKDVTIKSDTSGNTWISGQQGHRFFKDSFLNTELTFSPMAFSQSNKHVASVLVESVREWIKEEDNDTLFDLYCGVGFFSLLLRDMFKAVIAIDDNGVAIDCAKATKSNISADNIKFYCGDTDTIFPLCYERSHSESNTILIDPPRAGISKNLVNSLASINEAKSLYYISCDPATLARDAKLLTQSGAWKLDCVSSFDMFPRTKHIESIALFKR